MIPKNRLEIIYGSPTPLEIESPKLPPGRFNLPDLRTAQLFIPSGMPSLHRSTGACRRLRTRGNLGLESHIRYCYIK
jgi:hypothetical protein